MTLQGQQNLGGGSTAPPNNFVVGRAPPMTELDLRVLLHTKHARVISSLHSFTALVMRLTSITRNKISSLPQDGRQNSKFLCFIFQLSPCGVALGSYGHDYHITNILTDSRYGILV